MGESASVLFSFDVMSLTLVMMLIFVAFSRMTQVRSTAIVVTMISTEVFDSVLIVPYRFTRDMNWIRVVEQAKNIVT